ncbi:basic salivary proline-rich protein 2-like [Pectinophora gossypiella]|uniref:basic salivary proline-rich protein 2-like n=1 Tax=Pectinophora gossypiella TaxID=13191 RepID=UPI00214E8326|nr:basic salivary proline-rich protein 2-like [Pectinophora gossypiella]
MGKKRKHADSDEDYIRRKIRRLEEKLINKAKRNRVIYSSDDDLSSQSSDSPPPMEAECESPLPVIVHAPASPPSQPESPPPPDSPPPPPPSPLLPPPKPPLPPPTASPQHRKVDHKPASSSDSGRGRPHQAAARGSARGAHHRPGQRSPPPRRSYHK